MIHCYPCITHVLSFNLPVMRNLIITIVVFACFFLLLFINHNFENFAVSFESTKLGRNHVLGSELKKYSHATRLLENISMPIGVQLHLMTAFSHSESYILLYIYIYIIYLLFININILYNIFKLFLTVS